MRLQLTIPGPPQGQGRARIGRTSAGRAVAFTDPKTRSYAQLIQGEWIAADRPALGPGPYTLLVQAFHQRPAGHYRKDGQTLSAAGQRQRFPGKPDLDNIVKGILDALSSVGAIPDDRELIYLTAGKYWDGHARVQVEAQSLSGEEAA